MPGGAPGLQNRSLGGVPVHGEFDSHTLPPVVPYGVWIKLSERRFINLLLALFLGKCAFFHSFISFAIGFPPDLLLPHTRSRQDYPCKQPYYKMKNKTPELAPRGRLFHVKLSIVL